MQTSTGRRPGGVCLIIAQTSPRSLELRCQIIFDPSKNILQVPTAAKCFLFNFHLFQKCTDSAPHQNVALKCYIERNFRNRARIFTATSHLFRRNNGIKALPAKPDLPASDDLKGNSNAVDDPIVRAFLHTNPTLRRRKPLSIHCMAQQD